MAGQGTIGLETFEQLPKVDTVLVPKRKALNIKNGLASASRRPDTPWYNYCLIS
ncbi:MAG: hypothetical protein AB7E31_06495 [Desulfitobacterium sp.]